MRNGMLISLIIFICTALLLKPIMGYEGVWLAFTFFMFMRAGTLGIFYPRVEIDAK
jgi:MATE family multidrug resistance protein